MRSPFSNFTICTTGLVLVAVHVFAFVDAANAQDWLHPSLEQPLPQYQTQSPHSNSDRYPLFQQQPAGEPGAIPNSLEGIGTLNQGSPPSNMNGSGTLLAPNPLQSPMQNTDHGTKLNPADLRGPVQGDTESRSVFKPLPGNKLSKPSATPSPKSKSKSPSKKTNKKQVKKNKPLPPLVNYDIYRDRNPFPIDPRKPNSPCTAGPSSKCGCTSSCRKLPGLNGRPYQEKEPGACACGNHKFALRHPTFSVYWPRPFSANGDERNPDCAATRYQPCQEKRTIDFFDRFEKFKLVDYTRTDNGYSGRNKENYGCLGESNLKNSMAMAGTVIENTIPSSDMGTPVGPVVAPSYGPPVPVVPMDRYPGF